jgi:uncharacterized protein (TIGR00369 family)
MTSSPSVQAGDPASGPAGTPFSDALALDVEQPGEAYTARLSDAWSVNFHGTQHGGLLMALTARAGLVALDEHTPLEHPRDPLAVSASFLRAPEPGPVRLTTEVVKIGRTASVVGVTMSQDGRTALAATVTAGRLPDGEVEWARLPELPAEPPSDAPLTSQTPGRKPPLASACDVVLDPGTPYLHGGSGEPVLDGWARPIGEQPDPLFAVLAGDILPPVLYNTGRPGWAPTVQLTALLRARPAPGWLRLRSAATSIAGGWLDEDMTVVDSAGRLVCQARQLALAPLPR